MKKHPAFMLKNRFVLYLLLCPIWLTAQNLEQSDLPIIIIQTDDNATIVDEPKIPANMRILYNENGEVNRVDQTNYHFDGKIGIEIRGQSSQSFPKKSYSIETRDNTGEDKNVSLLGLPEESDWVIYSPYSDKSLLRNVLTYILAGRMMTYAPRVVLCELIINNEYLGVVVFTERIKRDKNRVDINKLDPDENDGDDLTGGYIIKFDKGDPSEIGWTSPYKPIPNKSTVTNFLYHYPKPEDISPEQKVYIKNYITRFENALYASTYTDPELGYRQYIDTKSFIDQIIVNEVTRNVDSYRLSTYMYKDKDSKGGKLAMGPVWDFNLAFGNANYCEGASTSGWAYDFNDHCPDDYWVNHFWWKRLMQDMSFRQELKDRYIHLRQGHLSNESVISLIDSLTAHIDMAKDRNFNKWNILNQYIWPNNFVGGTYQSEITYLKNWIMDRIEWLDVNIGALTTAVDEPVKNISNNFYPNPTKDYIQIDPLSELLDDEVFIYDISGRLAIHSKGSKRIGLAGLLKHGVYIIKARTIKNETLVEKLMLIP